MKRRANDTIVNKQKILLIVSGLLNAFFVALYFHSYMAPLSFELPACRPYSELGVNAGTEILEKYSSLSFDALTMKLGSVEREYALSCLVADHYFDLERAIGSVPEKHAIVHKGKSYPLYPAFGDAEYEKIIAYSKLEKYPFTTEGLLVRLRTPSKDDEELKTTLKTRSEYKVAMKLLQLPDDQLVSLLVDVPYSQLAKMGSSMASRHFLLEASQGGSKIARRLLLRGEQLCDLNLAIAPIPSARAIAETYVVQSGDSLWKIAKRHQTTVEAIRKQNKLENDTLKPGKVLKICHSTGS